MISYILKEPKCVEPQEGPKPVPQGHDALIRIQYVGICGSDIHLFNGSYNGPHSYPMRFGHEWSGVVEAVGSDVTAVKVGDVVTGDCSRFCGKCPSCGKDRNLCEHIEKFGITIDGASAEYILRDEKYLYKAPEGILIGQIDILNGAHTGFVLGAYLAGFDIVRDCMQDDTVRGFMNKMLHEEVIPTLSLDKDDLESFAAAVQDRFNNPFINHELLSISLNSTSKWKARNLPSLAGYIEKTGTLPVCLTMSLAAYIAFYSTGVHELTDKGLVCRRANGDEYTCSDDRWALEFYWGHKEDDDAALVHAVLTNTQMWDRDLTEYAGLEAAVLAGLGKIRTEGAKAAFASCL